MKPWIIVLMATGLIACDGNSTAPSASNAAPTALQDQTADLIFQGLMAFVYPTNDAGVAVDALLVDANDANADRDNLPNVVSGTAYTAYHFYMPAHIPYVALSDAQFEDGCFVTGEPRPFKIPAIEGPNPVEVQAYQLCGASTRCAEDITVGFSEGSTGSPDGLDLISRAHFSRKYKCNQDSFFKINYEGVKDKIAARVRVTGGTSFDARLVPNPDGTHDDFVLCALTGDVEDKEQAFLAAPLAEEVAVTGKGSILLKMGNAECKISPTSNKKMRVWILNVDPESYRPDSVNNTMRTHHEAFYWFYDLTPTPCKNMDGKGLYPRPCVVNGEHGAAGVRILGYPKCPQPLMEYANAS